MNLNANVCGGDQGNEHGYALPHHVGGDGSGTYCGEFLPANGYDVGHRGDVDVHGEWSNDNVDVGVFLQPWFQLTSATRKNEIGHEG